MKFIFDLDGTVTSQETLSLIAKHFNIENDIVALTKETLQGNIPFIESFIRRVHILGKLPVCEIADFLEHVHLHPAVFEFIQHNKQDCVIATGNLDCWIWKLVKRIGCHCYNSEAVVKENSVSAMRKILNKESVVKKYQEMGEKVVYIGDGNNDIEAMRLADVSIAAGLVHHPANSILPFADYLIFDEKALCRQLNQLL